MVWREGKNTQCNMQKHMCERERENNLTTACFSRERVNTSTTMQAHISTNYSITLKVTTKQFVYELLDDTEGGENVHSYVVCILLG